MIKLFKKFKKKDGDIKIKMNTEVVMNRLWLYDENGEIAGQVNFAISSEFAKKAYDAYFDKQYFTDIDGNTVKVFKSYEEFINVYTPEKEGNDMYLIALENDAVIEEYVTVDRTEYHLSYDLAYRRKLI